MAWPYLLSAVPGVQLWWPVGPCCYTLLCYIMINKHSLAKYMYVNKCSKLAGHQENVYKYSNQ